MAYPNGKDSWDWNGDDGANYTADCLMQGYACGRRTDVDFAATKKREFDAHCEAWPHLAPAWRRKWSVMLAKAKKFGW